MNTKQLMKKMTMGILATTLSVSVNASFLTIQGSGGFTSATNGHTNTLADPTANVLPIVNTATTSSVSWGTSIVDGQSSLFLEDEAMQSIDVLDQNYLLSTLTHNNNAINGVAEDFLSDATISGLLTLSGAFDALPSPLVIPTVFDIDFMETRNEITFGECASAVGNDEDGIVGGLGHTHITKCDDRFDYTVDGGSFPITIPLSISGFDYNLNIFAATDIAGTEVITANRFWTEEGKSTSVYTFARLARVPEPASIAILGLGLLGLAASKKRKS